MSSTGLAAAVDRLAHGTGSRRGAGEQFVAAVASGARPAEALERAGAGAAVSRLIADAEPADLEPVLRDLGLALELARARERKVAQTALYPALLAVVTLLLGWFLHQVVLPSLGALRASTDRLQAGAPTGGSLLAIAASAAALVLLALFLRSDRARFPFAGERTQQERALVLAAAAALARSGAPLPTSLRAAGGLARSAPLREACDALASALDAGSPQLAGTALLGETGAALFLSAASEGAGAASLAALADLHESVAAGELPSLLMRAELYALLLGAAGLLAAGAAFYSTYSGLLGDPR